MAIKDLLLNRGWAGKNITRAETVERINPLVEQHVRLNHYYRYAIEHLDNRELAGHLAQQQRTARTDVGKLNETILSAGAVPYSGTDIEREEIDLGTDDIGILYHIQDAEEELGKALTRELDAGDHQMRTRAILEVVQTNSERRLSDLKDVTRGRRRPEEEIST